MKNKKKISYVLLLVVGILLLTACGKNGGILSSKSLKASDLNIEDYEWETNASKCNGADCYVLSLINNSKYDIIGVDFTYKVKSGVSEADLDVYDDFMQDHEGYIDEDDSPKNITLRGSKNTLVKQGDELTGLRFTVG